MIAFHRSLKLRDLVVDNGLHAFIDHSILQDQTGAMDTNQDDLDRYLRVDATCPPWFGRESRRGTDAGILCFVVHDGFLSLGGAGSSLLGGNILWVQTGVRRTIREFAKLKMVGYARSK